MLRAEVVTADGGMVTASADRHPDLFWALRGGGNFGIVTGPEFRLHPVARVYAGTAYFPTDRAADMLGRYPDWAAGAPDELSTAVLPRRMPATRIYDPANVFHRGHNIPPSARPGALRPPDAVARTQR